jgi:NitT/TauT family transport system substrate-binding protein
MLDRRRLLLAAGAVGGTALLTWSAWAADAAPIRLALPSPGSGGSVWRPIVEQEHVPTSGLALDWIGGNPGQVEMQLLAGALDVSTFGAIGASLAVEHGSDLAIFGPGLNNHGHWLVRADSPFHAPKDLIGKRIAAQPETSETFHQARIAAALAGIDLTRDMSIIHGPPTASMALFERGDVDAVIMIEPTATRMVARGAREIASVADMWRDALGGDLPPFLVGLTAQRKWIDAHRDEASKLAALFSAINAEIHKRPEILSELHDFIGIPADERAAIELLPKRLVDIYPTGWGQPVFDAIDKQIALAVKVGVLPSPPPRPLYQALS